MMNFFHSKSCEYFLVYVEFTRQFKYVFSFTSLSLCVSSLYYKKISIFSICITHSDRFRFKKIAFLVSMSRKMSHFSSALPILTAWTVKIYNLSSESSFEVILSMLSRTYKYISETQNRWSRI